jgi:hypothetical protein
LDAYSKTLKGNSLLRKFRYSNLGAGILGNVLAGHENTDYATLIAQRITIPLQMSRTFLHIPQSEQPFVTQPHTKSLRPTPIWTMASLPGAGGLLPSMQDMLRFASAALSTTPPLFPFMIHSLAKADNTDRSVGLGWVLRATPEYQVAWHNGGTFGSCSFLGLEFKTGRHRRPRQHPSFSGPTGRSPSSRPNPLRQFLLKPLLHFSKGPLLFWMRTLIFPGSLFCIASRICCNSPCRCSCARAPASTHGRVPFLGP